MAAEHQPAPPTAPRSVDGLGVRRAFVEDLALKMLYLSGEQPLHELAQQLKVSIPVVEELFQNLRKQLLVQVTGVTAGMHRIVATTAGRARALEALALSQYVGAVPVALSDYVAMVRSQSVLDRTVSPADVAQAFAPLVLPADVLRQLGTAVVSGRAIFLYGPSGSGKSTVAEHLALLFRDAVWVPWAVEVDGQIITVFDEVVHQRLDPPDGQRSDGRWVPCRRPRVLVGGELTIEMLDLQFNPVAKHYAGPVQMKANNGVLIVDDFGRQRVSPDHLLNRWVVPLDRRIDFLTLTGGRKLEIPFDLFVVFATNLDPATLVDEAFLRRIQTKIHLDNIGEAQFHEIFRRAAATEDVAYDQGLVDALIHTITQELGEPLRACQPRDIIAQVCWNARYEDRKPELTQKTVAQACDAYFLQPRT